MVLFSSEDYHMNSGLRALVYCRSSRGATRGLQAQEQRCRLKASAAGATDMVTIIDHDRGSANIERPAVGELRELLRTGTVGWVVVDSPERLSRRVRDLRSVIQEIAGAGARLIFVAP